MIRIYISLIDTLIKKHPEHATELGVILRAMKVLNSAEYQLDRYMLTPLFSEVLKREKEENLIDPPRSSIDNDIYKPINQDIIEAVKLIGVENTSHYLQRALGRESMLANGVFKAKQEEKRKTEAKNHGKTGGLHQKEIVAPLQQEIRRLFLQAIKSEPNLRTKKAYAHKIHADVETFIQMDPKRYAHVGPKDKSIDSPYQRYILDSLKDISLK